MKKIWKFELLEETDRQSVKMPKGAKIISCQVQHGVICMWAIVEPDSEFELRIFQIVGTGNPMPDCELEFLATVQQLGGQLVWHIFEAK